MAPLPLPLLSNGTNEELSLHEIRIANAIRVGPGNYRLAVPKVHQPISLAVDHILRSPRDDNSSSKRREADYSLASDIAYFKMGAITKACPTRKRVHYPDTQVTNDSSSRKHVHFTKRDGISMNKIMAKPVTSESASSGSNERPNVVESQVDVDIYEEVAGTGEYDYTSGDVLSPSLVSESRDVVPGATYRELKGENKYLKEQLHANVLRIKQLEALLVLRNGHVKTLVSDNLQLLLKCQKLMEALGEEEAKEVLS